MMKGLLFFIKFSWKERKSYIILNAVSQLLIGILPIAIIAFLPCGRMLWASLPACAGGSGYGDDDPLCGAPSSSYLYQQLGYIACQSADF